MKEEAQAPVVDESLEDSLRYTEVMGDNEKGTYRDCSLWIPDKDKPVSGLKFFDFEQRFGGAALPTEGIGDVSTDSEHRRKGYISKLMRRALAGSAARVDAVFLFGIGRLYGNFGFTTCLASSHFTLWLKGAEHLSCPETLHPDSIAPEDLSAIVRLFNAEHRLRAWTRVRDDKFTQRLFHQQTWRPGPEGLVLKEGEKIHAYGLVEGYGYGWGKTSFKVMETAADSPESAQALISILRDRALQRGVDTITFWEPPDSAVGRTLRSLGGEQRREFSADGGGMGLITNRPSLIRTLEGELNRRIGNAKPAPGAFAALAAGELIPDSADLLRLLVGYWSWEDAKHAGVRAPEKYGDTLGGWFPGGGKTSLPAPFAHDLDGY